ncbi:ATP synthase F1 subunit delta [Mesonia maritima]|uniref:ATP synthase subunit delta n=1 Tax=Mesonia maritima TaxID=1793873 RepID=A0ABU1K5K5_9FLAO|nr:ATP synthase F1 subunit delta [Mesonia maritima]MDR6299848.1 F-type H+-transporting ATPase subunit delta [Mesonia maritima]
MANTRAANRYAKALLDLAKEKKQTEEVFADMKLIHNTIKNSKDLRSVLKSPVIKPSAKHNVVKAIFAEVNPISQSLFNILIQNNRIAILETVVKSYVNQYNELMNIKAATVTTAEALTPEMEAKVLAKVKDLTGSKATLKNIVDKTILGGFILRIGDVQYDASVSGKLNALRNKFKNNAYV